jgi:hypothetical protein
VVGSTNDVMGCSVNTENTAPDVAERGASQVMIKDTLWSWVSSQMTRKQNLTHTLSSKTNALKMVVRNEGGKSIFFAWSTHNYRSLYTDKNKLTSINNVS